MHGFRSGTRRLARPRSECAVSHRVAPARKPGGTPLTAVGARPWSWSSRRRCGGWSSFWTTRKSGRTRPVLRRPRAAKQGETVNQPLGRERAASRERRSAAAWRTGRCHRGDGGRKDSLDEAGSVKSRPRRCVSTAHAMSASLVPCRCADRPHGDRRRESRNELQAGTHVLARRRARGNHPRHSLRRVR